MKIMYLLRHRLFLMSILLCSSFFSNGQITSTYAVGTTTNTTLPIVSNYGYTYSEQIYLATDFDAAVQGQLNEITKIRFYLNATSLGSSEGWTVYMGQTTLTSFASNTSWITASNMTQVFSGNVVPPSSAGWMEITLNTPFIWDGVSNVVVGVDENTPGFGSLQSWRTNSTGSNRSIMYRNDSTNPDPLSPPTAFGRYGYVAQAQFVHNLAPACSGTPTHATLTSSAPGACTGGTVNFNLGSPQFASGFNIVWQYNDGTGWTNFANTTSSPTFSAVITESIDVRAVRTCIASTLFDNSDVVSITEYSLPTVTVNVPNEAICSGGAVAVNASGANTYVWSPSAGLNTTTGASVVATPTANTTYTVTGTDANGCVNTATSTISPIGDVMLNVSNLSGSICAPGTPLSIVASVTPSVQTLGIWEYRFLAADGATVLQNWNFSDTYTFTPTTDSIYTIYYQARNTGCSDYIDSVATKIKVGFGAEVTVIDYDCNNLGGTISLDDIFGQGNETIVYNNPMTALTSELTMTGTASVTGGRAVLTPSQTGATGAMDVAIPGYIAGVNNSMKVSFNMTMDTPINVFGTGGGDGLAYSFGNDAVQTGLGPHANGKGSKLRLSFDAANNGSNSAGIYLIYGYTGTAAIPVADPATIAYSPNTSAWKLLTDVPVEMVINPQGQVKVTVGTTVIFNNVQLPLSYLSENVTNWKHLFSANTGGDALRQAVSNVQISTESLEYAIVTSGTTPTFADYGYSSVKTNVQPGMYDVWIATDSASLCVKMIGTYEVVNTNPVVELGNDTTICSGQSLTLDAGNAGSTYVWSNSNNTSQTNTITTGGSYVAYVTAPNSCVGVGTINVSVIGAPSTLGIYSQGNFPIVFLSAMNPQNVTNYSWDFGDNTAAPNGPSSISHTYSMPGTYTVTLTVSNACGTETYTETISVNDVTGLEENNISGIELYPNPASEIVTLKMIENTNGIARVVSMTGAVVSEVEIQNGKTTFDVKQWEKGIYFIHVQNENQNAVVKLIVR